MARLPVLVAALLVALLVTPSVAAHRSLLGTLSVTESDFADQCEEDAVSLFQSSGFNLESVFDDCAEDKIGQCCERLQGFFSGVGKSLANCLCVARIEAWWSLSPVLRPISLKNKGLLWLDQCGVPHTNLDGTWDGCPSFAPPEDRRRVGIEAQFGNPPAVFFHHHFDTVGDIYYLGAELRWTRLGLDKPYKYPLAVREGWCAGTNTGSGRITYHGDPRLFDPGFKFTKPWHRQRYPDNDAEAVIRSVADSWGEIYSSACFRPLVCPTTLWVDGRAFICQFDS